MPLNRGRLLLLLLLSDQALLYTFDVLALVPLVPVGSLHVLVCSEHLLLGRTHLIYQFVEPIENK